MEKEKTRAQFGRAANIMKDAEWFTDEERARKLAEFANIKKGAKVLDIACGNGPLSAYLCKNDATVIGIDLTPVMLIYAKQNCSKCAFICADAEKLPCRSYTDRSYSKLFDFCVARACIHHIQNIHSLLREISLVSNVLIIEDTSSSGDSVKARLHNSIEKIRDPSHNWMYPITELRRIVESEGFVIETWKLVESNREFEDWMNGAAADWQTRLRCRTLFINSIRNGRDDTGLNVRQKDGRIVFTHKRFLLKATYR